MLFRAYTPVPPDADAFRKVAPYFANPEAYPDDAIDFWLSIAQIMLPECRWRSLYGVGVILFTAHNLYLQAQNIASQGPGGTPGQQRGIIASESAGSVSVSYDNNVATEEGAGHWNRSIWGQEFYRLMQLVGAGPVQLNVPNWGGGIPCPPAFNTGALGYNGMAGSVGPGWYYQNPQENVPVGKFLPKGPTGLLPVIAFAALLLPLMGCYNLITANVGVNKSVGALAAPLTPEAACAALVSPSVVLRPPASTSGPEMTVTGQSYQQCIDILERARVAEAKHAH